MPWRYGHKIGHAPNFPPTGKEEEGIAHANVPVHLAHRLRRQIRGRSLVPSKIWFQCLKVPPAMLGGKLLGLPLVETSAASRQKGRLHYVTDHESRLRFLVDTGAEVSILPPSKAERKN